MTLINPRRVFRVLPVLALVLVARAQQASFTPTPAQLARFDLNKDGKLDASELAALQAAEAKPVTAASTTGAGSEVLELTPFEVNAANDKGYYASNTLSGTRINSKLEDLGASISVVTKQQMQDFALLDINDVFLYEANTEGTGNYTDTVVDRNGNVIDNVSGNPQGANRVRGVGAANTARGNFQTSGRVPIDPINIDGVEISRGPNSNIFGLGNASGTVNILPASANLTRETTSVEFRADSYGSTRESLDFNRPLIRGKLALRGSYVHQEDEFVRKPAFSRSNRYNAMLTFKPTKSTTLRASYERYENYARRPNAILPRDAVSYWQQQGRPTWDPSTWTVTRNGVKTVVPYNSNTTTENTGLGAGLETGGTGLYARPSIFIDQGAVGLWMIGRISGISTTTLLPTPDFQAGNQRFVESAPAPRAGPLAPTVTSITDKALYDWTKTNIAASNWNQDRVNTYSAELEQMFLNTQRHVLAAQLGWFREDAQRYNRQSIGQGSDAPMVVYVDVNEKLLDGRPNPYFLRPYINALEPTVTRQPLQRDIYRAQFAYKLSLAREKGWWHWLGDHAVSAYGEYKDTVTANYRFRDVITSNHTWLPAGGNRAAGTTAARSYYRYYLGDNQGQNVEYGSPAWNALAGSYNLSWYNAQTSQWVAEPATIGEAYYNAANPQRSGNVIKTKGVVTQNHLLDGRVVTTFGLRKDANFNRNAASTALAADGISADYASDDSWPNDWFRRDGTTKSQGVVMKPFRGWRPIDRWADSSTGVTRVAADFVRSLNFHLNKADSFTPATIAQSLTTRLLPDPTGTGKDYGVSFNVADKLVLRFNAYESAQRNSRTGDAGTIATRAGRIDFAFAGSNDQFNLQRQATAWITSAHPTWTTAQIATEVAKTMGFPEDQLARMNAYPIAETSDVVSKGKEIELSYNPTRFWTSRVTVANQAVIEQNVTPAIQQYIDSRLPVWTKVIDLSTGQPWFTTRYGSAGTASDFLNGSVLAPYKLLRANEGKSRPQIRQWRVNAFSTLQLAAITDNAYLKRVNVSGAVRWEDRASIGYYAYDNDPNAYDPSRRVYDKGHTYVDMGAGYTTRIFSNKIGLRVQLNVRNVFESGRLQPVAALPNGVPYSFRIIDPRLIILTTSFSL
jgi:outer membrane receptor protein involved in Fe transport